MIQQCRENGLPDPEWESDEKLGVTVTFRAAQATPQVKKFPAALTGEMPASELLAAVGMKDRVNFRDTCLKPALKAGAIEVAHPDKPNSSKQRYPLTRWDKPSARISLNERRPSSVQLSPHWLPRRDEPIVRSNSGIVRSPVLSTTVNLVN